MFIQKVYLDLISIDVMSTDVLMLVVGSAPRLVHQSSLLVTSSPGSPCGWSRLLSHQLWPVICLFSYNLNMYWASGVIIRAQY